MKSYKLRFLSDEAIYNLVRETIKCCQREISLAKFNENTIDPVKLIFDAKVYGKGIHEVIEDECFRQIDKANANSIGRFHQNLFKYAGHGWSVPEEGFDVGNKDLHVFAEIKKKANAMSTTAAQKSYIKMQAKILEDSQATCYLVEIMSDDSKDEEWSIFLDNNLRSHKRIRRISIDKFCGLVFGEPNAFFKLCMALPTVIEDVINDDPMLQFRNTLCDELSRKHTDLLKAVYLLAFSNYEGFQDIQPR